MELMGTMELLCLNRANAMLIGEQGFFGAKMLTFYQFCQKKGGKIILFYII